MNRLYSSVAAAAALLLIPATPALAAHAAKKHTSTSPPVYKLGPKLGMIAAVTGGAPASGAVAVAANVPPTPTPGATQGFGCKVYIPTDASGSTGENVQTQPNTLDVVSLSQAIDTSGNPVPGWGSFLFNQTTCSGQAPAGYYTVPPPPQTTVFTYYTSCVTHQGFLVKGGGVLTLNSNGSFTFVCTAYSVVP